MSGLGFIDIFIVAVYILVLVCIGLWAKKRAARGVDAYFLGDRKLPWWMLAMSGSSSYWDITGTMWIVSLLCIMGMKAMWHQWIWGFPLPVFFAFFMGKWINKSKVLTAAEWMKTRFGEDRAGSSARSAYAVLAIVTVTGFLAYDAVGMGKFGTQFLPFSKNVCSILILGTTGIYIIFGGFHSLILTEVVQTIIMSVGALVICIIGFTHVDLAALAQKAAGSFYSLSIHWKEPAFAETEFFLFGALAIAWVSKGFLLCFGGPEQLYDFQRFLSAKNEKDASKLGLLWGALHTLRWPMAMGIALLFLSGFKGVKDYESVLPAVINEFLPVGVRGIVLAALLAAFMSTFNSTVNAGASYLVVDIYKKHLNPKATQKQLVRAGYLSSFLLIATGIAIGATAQSIHKVFQWIMAALGAGVLLPNFLRWYWWRLNGWGYSIGVFASLALAIVVLFNPEIPEYVYAPILNAVALLGCVLGSLLTRPVDDATIGNFFRRVRPLGWWGPVRARSGLTAAVLYRGQDHPGRIVVNVVLGMTALFSSYLFPIYLIGHWFLWATVSILVFTASAVALYFTWYRWLEHDEDGPAASTETLKP